MMTTLLDWKLFQNTALDWIIAAGIAIGITVVLSLARVMLLRNLRPDRTAKAVVLDIVRHTRYTFIALLAISVAGTTLVLSKRTTSALHVISGLVVLLQIGWWGHGLIKFWVQRVIRERLKTDAGSVTVIRTVGVALRFTLFALIFLSVIATLGFDVNKILAGLGIGGIAIALAVQNIVGDLFASVSIIVDKPFVVGDFIQVGDKLGTVQVIGLKSTRLASLSGEQLIFGNGDLLKSRIQNYKRMKERRIVFTVGIEYGTPADLVEKAPQMIRDAIVAQSDVRFDRAHFKQFGDSALIYEAVYIVLSPDFNVYMDIQQKINFELYRGFEKAGISMAFPTRTVMLRLDAADVKVVEELTAAK
jgi:small-conductance mechanosensitive channel